ncbi:M48 family metalloprotease [Streptomyces caniscabiei]|uniref:M48 family metalloprotease n=2 Tax=Streptomyces caniscabiei TaxID=2746961 RepID=UPI0029BAC317|nr:M48 family metalloprotease [Streptomyces caniscabiei]MDX2604191.1 M48 family metalloprotease [Streptomyces caniscabiei]MDX2739228.1 M48 family metalloprotease [Streptomyces caniscabiei]
MSPQAPQAPHHPLYAAPQAPLPQAPQPVHYAPPPPPPPAPAPVTTPGAEFPAAYAPVGTPEVRRGADSSSVTTLLLNIPLFLGSLLVMFLISLSMPSGVDVAFIVAWLASGALVFNRPTERGLAKLYFKMREPMASELAVLQPIWYEVTQRAGVDGSKYDLWMEDTDELNASAAAGHIVGVTRGAMRSLPPQQLAAVLAHELGHHVGGHAWAGLLGHWYAVPARLVMSALRLVIRVLAAISEILAGLFVIFLGILAIALLFTFPAALALYAVPFLLAWSGRQGELRADRFAGLIGYGPLLVSVFTAWHAAGADDALRKQRAMARLMSTHPPLHKRIRAIETFVA